MSAPLDGHMLTILQRLANGGIRRRALENIMGGGQSVHMATEGALYLGLITKPKIGWVELTPLGRAWLAYARRPPHAQGTPTATMVDDAFRAKYPESAKFDLVRDKAQVVSEFLEWLQGEDISLAHYPNQDSHHLEFIRESYTKLLARFFEIDEDARQREMEQMLDEMRAGEVG